MRATSVFMTSVLLLVASASFASSLTLVDSLKKAITTVDQSFSACEIEEHPHSPKNVLFRLVNQYPASQLCSALKSLSKQELLYYFEALRELNKKYILVGPEKACLQVIYFKSEILMEKSTLPLEFYSNISQRTQLNQSIKITPHPAQPILGPSEEVILDTLAGPKYVFADLPKKHIAFTFDDGPHGKYTKELLKVLESHQVKATFFTVGKNVAAHGSIVRDIEHNGHTLANHSQTHANMRKLSNRSGEKEVNEGFSALLKEAKNVSPFFRFPYGNHTSHLRSYLQHENIGEFFWSIDTLDWKIKDPTKLYHYALEQIEKTERGIILFHDVQYQTVKMMPHLLQSLAKKGYTVVLLKPSHYL